MCMKGMLAVLLVLGGCASKPSPLTADQPSKLFTSEDAREVVLHLPEVDSFFKFLDRETKGKVQGIIFEDGEFNDGWIFYVGEDHDDHTTVWERFIVNHETHDVNVLDVGSDEWITLTEWRRKPRIASNR